MKHRCCAFRRFFGISLGVALTTVCSLLASVGIATAVTPTQSQYIAHADALCRAVNTKVLPLDTRVNKIRAGSPGANATVAALFAEVTTIESKYLVKIRALPKPQSDAHALVRIWNALETDVADTAKVAVATRQGKAAAVLSDAQALVRAKTKYDRLAQTFGFEVCGASKPITR